MNWADIEEVAEQLDQTYPDVDPRDLILSQLQKMVLELPDFHEKAQAPDQEFLTRIQKEWDRIRR